MPTFTKTPWSVHRTCAQNDGKYKIEKRNCLKNNDPNKKKNMKKCGAGDFGGFKNKKNQFRLKKCGN